jgi:hypothetical protein
MQGKPTVLELAAGNTLKRVHQVLILLHQSESLIFANSQVLN